MGTDNSRREFMKNGLFVGTGLTLTPSSGRYDDIPQLIKTEDTADDAKAPSEKDKKTITEKNILGPYYRNNPPVRAKVTPPFEPGNVIVIKGCVYGFDTQKPLASAMIDIWQADKNGDYDHQLQKKLKDDKLIRNRIRIITDQNGQYEYESILPGRYKIGANSWRPAHIHYMVKAKGYKKLITQMYFKGDPFNNKDRFIRKSLIVDMQEKKVTGGTYKEGQFDIVLEKTY